MTEVPLKEHLETKLEALDRVFTTQLEALATALKLATDALDHRLQGMNEFRDALKDQAGRLATKDEVSALREVIDTRLKALEVSRAYAAGVAAVVGAMAGVAVSLVIKGGA